MIQAAVLKSWALVNDSPRLYPTKGLDSQARQKRSGATTGSEQDRLRAVAIMVTIIGELKFDWKDWNQKTILKAEKQRRRFLSTDGEANRAGDYSSLPSSRRKEIDILESVWFKDRWKEVAVLSLVWVYEGASLQRRTKQRQPTVHPKYVCAAAVEWTASHLSATSGVVAGVKCNSNTRNAVLVLMSVVKYYFLHRFPLPYALYLVFRRKAQHLPGHKLGKEEKWTSQRKDREKREKSRGEGIIPEIGDWGIFRGIGCDNELSVIGSGLFIRAEFIYSVHITVWGQAVSFGWNSNSSSTEK
eukprot:Gb_19696 [translate_table: standard]